MVGTETNPHPLMSVVRCRPAEWKCDQFVVPRPGEISVKFQAEKCLLLRRSNGPIIKLSKNLLMSC